MAKNKMLGVEIGNNRIKIAVCSNYDLERIVYEELPDNLVMDDEIVSWESMADFIKDVVKRNNITYKEAAVVLPEKNVYFQRLLMPAMSIDQLRVNLPYEFHDYISEDKDKYFYDYSLINMKNDDNDNPIEMDLMAIAAPKELIEKYKTMFRRAGLKLVLIAPEFAAFRNIIKDYEEVKNINEKHDYAILDIGHRMLKLNFFTKGEFEVTRGMEPGCDAISSAICDKLGVDRHIAKIYKEKNQDNILSEPECMEIYKKMAIDIMRVLNFYNFNHPDNNLDTMYYCGGGALIKPLLEEIASTVEIRLASIEEILTDKCEDKATMMMGPQALGITWE